MRTFLTTTAATILLALPAAAASVVGYASVNGATAPATIEGAGVTGADLMRGTGLTQNTGNTFNSRGWTEGGDKATAIANDDVLTWGFASTQSYDLTGLSLGYDRSPTGPVSIAVDLSVNGGAFVEIFADMSVSVNGETAVDIDLSAFDAVTAATFRLAGWGATGSLGTFDPENRLDPGAILVTGEASVAPVPLPAAGVLLLAGLGGLAAARRRG